MDLFPLIEQICREEYVMKRTVYEMRINVSDHWCPSLQEVCTSFGIVKIIFDNMIPKDSVFFFSKAASTSFSFISFGISKVEEELSRAESIRRDVTTNTILIKNISKLDGFQKEIKKKAGRQIEIGEW